MEPWSVTAPGGVVLIAAYILLIATMSLDKFVIITLCTGLCFGWAGGFGYGFLATLLQPPSVLW